MDIMELGAIGELVGGVTVIGTLIYLASQVRQGNRLARSQVQHDSARMSSDLLATSNREGLDILERLANDPSEVGESDLRLARAGFVAVLNYYETFFYAHQRGDVEPDIWESRKFRMAAFIGPVRDLLWEPAKPGFGKRFREFIDHEILPTFSSDDGGFLYQLKSSTTRDA